MSVHIPYKYLLFKAFTFGGSTGMREVKLVSPKQGRHLASIDPYRGTQVTGSLATVEVKA